MWWGRREGVSWERRRPGTRVQALLSQRLFRQSYFLDLSLLILSWTWLSLRTVEFKFLYEPSQNLQQLDGCKRCQRASRLCDKVFPTGLSPQAQRPYGLGFWGLPPSPGLTFAEECKVLAQGRNESLLANFVSQCHFHRINLEREGKSWGVSPCVRIGKCHYNLQTFP